MQNVINNWDDWEFFTSMEKVVRDHVVDTDRWHQYWEAIVKDDNGLFWQLSWRDGATEYQDLDFEDRDCCAIQVVPYEETVTKYKAA